MTCKNCEHLADDVPVLAENLIKGLMDRAREDEAREGMRLFHRNMEGGGEWKKVIIEKGGIILLLKMLKEGSVSQVIGANVLVSLAHHLECAEQLVVGEVVPFFANLLKKGNMEAWAEVALAMCLLANHSEGDGCKKMLIEEGVIGPLLNLLIGGNVSNQVIAAKVLASLAYDLESARHLVVAGVVPVYAKILKVGVTEVQAEVALAVYLLANHSEGDGCKKMLIEEGVIGLLLNLLIGGNVSNQVIAAKVLASLAYDLESARHLVVAGVVPVYAKILKVGVTEVQAEVALAVYLLANHSEGDRCKKMLIEEGVIGPLLKLLKEDNVSNQVIAAKVLANLACDLESAQHLVVAGVVPVYAKILKVGVTEVQAEVACAVSKLAANDSKCQDAFTQHHVIQPLVNHLAFETVEENFEDWMHFNKATSVLAVVMSISLSNRTVTEDGGEHKQSLSLGDPASATTKARMKAMAAKALGNLAKGNTSICRTICETRALMCFAVLLDSGIKEVQYYSATALMEITTVAVQNADLRRFFFRPSLRAFKVIVDNIVNIIGTETSDVELLIPCIRTIGNLARTFRVVERRIIVPLVGLLAAEHDNVCQEALIAIMKFASRDNILALENSRAIIDAGGVCPLLALIQAGKAIIRKPALVLLCNVVILVPNNEGVSRKNILAALKSAQREVFLTQDETVRTLVKEAKDRLML